MSDEKETPRLWSPNLALGIPLIDGQHRNLVERLEGLLRALQSDRPEHDLRQCLDFVDRYTHEHFHTEERFMAMHSFPGLGAHQKQHREFQATVVKARRFIESNPRSDQSAQLVRSLLVNWYLHHIRGADQEYASFFRGKDLAGIFES